MSMEPQETNMYGKPNTYRLEGVGGLEMSVLKKRSHDGAKQAMRVCLTSVTTHDKVFHNCRVLGFPDTVQSSTRPFVTCLRYSCFGFPRHSLSKSTSFWVLPSRFLGRNLNSTFVSATIALHILFIFNKSIFQIEAQC
jgi:hypothetical protein